MNCSTPILLKDLATWPKKNLHSKGLYFTWTSMTNALFCIKLVHKPATRVPNEDRTHHSYECSLKRTWQFSLYRDYALILAFDYAHIRRKGRKLSCSNLPNYDFPCFENQHLKSLISSWARTQGFFVYKINCLPLALPRRPLLIFISSGYFSLVLQVWDSNLLP